MASNDTISFDGSENLEEIFKKLPEKQNRAIMLRVFRKAARPIVRDMRRELPTGLRKAIGTKPGRNRKYPSLSVGLIYRNTTSAMWFKSYWRTWGTLDNRDPGHKFAKGRKNNSRSWQGGIEPKQSVLKVIPNGLDAANDVIENETAAVTTKFLQKYAVP